MSRLPQVSGAQVARLLQSLGYQFVRQRGSHARYSLTTHLGTHNITIPMHKVIAKGTLNDILTQVSMWTGMPKDELIKRL
ncbi:MAG TPA: type II toxin-antitoxin system HicA family toxin [Thermodesulfobacteriota bacterium]|nr:type II toxin-antitoxin system HicA family toxin [Thermodesulfobacteriota bacterium]